MENLQAQAIGLMQIVIGGVFSIAGIFLTALVAKGVAYAKVKTSAIKEEQAKSAVNETLDKTDKLLKTYIISLENTMKPSILQAIADGVVDKAELNSLATIVKESTVKQLGNGGMKILNQSLGDANSYLVNRIEKILAELKSAPGIEVNKTVIIEPSAEVTESKGPGEAV